MTENELATLLQARGAERSKRTWRCPDEARLAAYADNQLEDRARHSLEDHLAGCEFCPGQLAFLARLQGSEPPEQVPPQLLARARELAAKQTRSLWVPGLRWATAFGAAASLLLVATLWLNQPEISVSPPSPPEGPSPESLAAPPPIPPAPAEPLPSVRSRQPEPVAPELLFPAEGSVVRAGYIDFQWRGMPRSLFYEIRVVTAEGDLVWRGRAEATRVQLPPDVQLAAGQKYFVWVRAYLPEGKTAKSAVVGFNVGGNN